MSAAVLLAGSLQGVARVIENLNMSAPKYLVRGEAKGVWEFNDEAAVDKFLHGKNPDHYQCYVVCSQRQVERLMESVIGNLKMKTPEEILQSLKSGADWGRGGIRISWVSDDKRFVLFTVPGASAWSGVGQPWKWSPTHHFLLDLSLAGKLEGYRLCVDCRVGRGVNGRLTKTVLEEFKSRTKSA